MQDYLQRVVGNHARTMVTSVRRFDSWADLPWDDTLPRPQPLPPGPALLIGMRDVYLGPGHPGPEGFMALMADQDELVIAAQLARSVIGARRGV